MPLQTTPTASTHVPESCGMGRARFAGSRVVLGAYVSRNFKICASFSSLQQSSVYESVALVRKAS